jgi:hypothetical protein
MDFGVVFISRSECWVLRGICYGWISIWDFLLGYFRREKGYAINDWVDFE